MVATGVLTIAHPGRCFQGCLSTRTGYYDETPFSLSESIHGWQMVYEDRTERRSNNSPRDVKVVITSQAMEVDD